jgi:hypothetical protein
VRRGGAHIVLPAALRFRRIYHGIAMNAPRHTRNGLARRTVPVLLVVLMAVPAGVAAQDATPVEGAWERIFLRVVLPDTTVEETYEGRPRLHKILTATHFAFGQQSEDGQDVYAGGGRYTYTGDTYVEVIAYHASPSMVGRTVTFESRLEDGLWHIAGTIGRFRLEETWRRLP